MELSDLDEWKEPEGGENPPSGRDPVPIARDPMALIGGDIANLYEIGRRVGSASTNPTGEFVVQLTTKDFNQPRKAEQKPDLIMVAITGASFAGCRSSWDKVERAMPISPQARRFGMPRPQA